MKEIIKLENGNVRVRTINKNPSRTQQQFVEQCDVNNIMKKYRVTGQITHLNTKQGVYADMSSIKNYQENLNTVIEAQNAFMALPSDVRKRFSNDPAELIDFLADKKNDEEAIKLGLKIKKNVPGSNDETKKSKNKNDDKPIVQNDTTNVTE